MAKKSVFKVRGDWRGKIKALLKWADIVAVQDAKNKLRMEERVDLELVRFVEEPADKAALTRLINRCTELLAKNF